MFSEYLEREEYEDDLYRDSEDDSGLSAESDVEGYLYSQLHYASSPKDSTRGSAPEPKIQPQVEDPLVKKNKPPEVIVIDSGSDVVLTSDDDDGVCSYKVSKTCLTRKTPATPRTSSVSRRPSAPPVEVVMLGSDDCSEKSSEENSCQSSSDTSEVNEKDLDLTSESDSDSDSDRLEKWMILGQDKHKEDQSILLNVEGAEVTDDLDSSLWKVSQRDQMAQIFNKTPGDRRSAGRPARRYYTEKSIVCNNCSQTGHLSKSCPRPQKLFSCLHCGQRGHLYRECPQFYCRNCGLPGHMQDVCLEQSYWHKHCHRCNMKGHFQDACPQIWRQFHVTTRTGLPCEPSNPQAHRTPPYCCNCSQKGHFGFECSDKRMFSGTYPTLPFITHYDKPRDFKRREHHLQKKANALAEAGQLDFSPDSQTEDVVYSTPPKKQKTHTQGVQYNHPTQYKPKHHSLVQSSSKPKNTQQLKRPIHRKAHQKAPLNPGPEKHPWRGTPTPPRSGPNQPPATQNKKKKKKKRAAQLFLAEDEDFPRGPKEWSPNSSGMLFRASRGDNAKKRRNKMRARERKAARGLSGMQPADENLFAIKQRPNKRRR